jgi:L-aminopeptidase/D-esterase-like protein
LESPRSHFIQECGQLTGYVAITGTNQLGCVYNGQSCGIYFLDFILRIGVSRLHPEILGLPVVGETFDRMTHPLGRDPLGITDVSEALTNMTSGKLREGNVGCV